MLHNSTSSQNEIAVQVRNLGKAYRIGVSNDKEESMVKALAKSLAAPFRNYKKLRSLREIKSGDTSTDVHWANRNINFDLYRGEVLGIIGKNGAGKSTLLKMLSRITEPTEGRIDLYGRVASLLEVGTGFNPDLTGKENIYLNGTILGLTRKEIDEQYDSIVEFSGIEKFIETPVKRYSSGMKVRLAFAVAAHLNPEILIIDEVLAVGDAEFQKKCLGKMQDIASGEGRTVLFVSHDMAAVRNLCTRALLLQNGTIVKEGDPTSVIDHYLRNTTTVGNVNNSLNFDNRKGNGKFRVTNISFLDKHNHPVSVLETGMELNIEISYEAEEIMPNPIVNVIIRNNIQNVLANFLSRDSFNGRMTIDKTGNILLHIPKLPLLPGRYSIDYNLKYDRILTDAAEGVLFFDVEKGDFFGTGKLNDSFKNGLLVEHNWEVNG